MDDTYKNRLLIIISGPSGVGKGSICAELVKRDKSLALSVSATTRQKGEGEEHGREYFFYSDDEFQETIDSDGFLEWAEVHGRRYGTLRDKVREIMNEDKDCILEIDVQGGLQVQQTVGRFCVMIFVKAPSEEELVRRITNRRRETPEDIRRRMMTARWEMTQEDKYHYTVVNDDLQEVVGQILEIIREERKTHETAIH